MTIVCLVGRMGTMSRSHRFLIQSHKKAGNQDASHPLPVVFLWRPQSPASERSQNFFHSSSHIIPHPPFLLHRPPPSPLFSLLSVNPPRPDYEVGGTSPSSFTPIKFTVRKGGRGCAVVETSISDNCFWQVEQVIRRI